MEVRSIYKYARISPLKARDVARQIQGLPVSQAIDILTFTPRKAAQLINKTLKSAVANAENNHELNAESLVVKEATVGKGPTFRRFKARARGSAGAIRKPTSHIRIIVTDELEIPAPQERSKAPEKKRVKPVEKQVVEPANEPEADVEAAPAAEEVAPAPAGGKGVTRLDERLGVVYEEPPSESDDLKSITGVGEVLEAKLHEGGIFTYRQIAGWNEEQVSAFGELLAAGDRIQRDDWVGQAKALHEQAHGESL